MVSNGGLGFKNKKLTLNVENTLDVTDKGQNISDNDLLVLQDITRGGVRCSTFKNLYEGYLTFKVPHPDGPKHSLQFKGAKEFEGSANLIFEPANHTLSVKGKVKALDIECSRTLQTNGDLEIYGGFYKNINIVSAKRYTFKETDNTVLFDTSENTVTAILPSAADNLGRILTIKKICREEDKYKIRGNYLLKIKTEGELMDFSSEITIKSTYSIRAFHSDGTKWWIINRSGS